MLRRNVRRRAVARGVTLVEVLIVVAILALIAGGVAMYAIPRFIEAQKKTAETDTKALLSVVEAWRLTHTTGECPTVDRLRVDRALPPDRRVDDPWGTPYAIVCSEGGDGVSSRGPDRKDATDDDIWAGTRPPH
jgi:general secretion pathway protein G